MNSWSIAMPVALLAMLLVGCSGMDTKDEEAEAVVEDISAESSLDEDEAARTQGVTEGPGFAGSPLEDPASLLSTRLIYFEFDSSEIQGQYHELIAAHAAYLGDHPEVSVTLEGHADERGSREYNIGLGERRAQSVAKLLLLQGATENQVVTVSYGEEQPVVFGHDEESWTQNRRVELRY